MHDLLTKLERLEGNVKSLIRKLNKANSAYEKLKNENIKLKEELQKIEAVVKEKKESVNVSTSSSPNKEEKYHKIKADIQSCINEVDACIQLIEQ